MPELPEVETVKCGLSSVMTGETIAMLKVRRPDLRFPFPAGFRECVEGAAVTAMERRAKFLLVKLSRSTTVIVHLGMSGYFRIDDTVNKSPLAAHDHVVFDMQNGTRVIYNDPRRFGFMDLWPTMQLDDYPRMKTLGPEPLSKQFSPHYLAGKLKHKTAPIKPALLNQNTIAGLGNIYVCEALHHAGIHPQRPAASLTDIENDRLFTAINKVIAQAITAGGSTIADFANPIGTPGYFQMQFRVYGREGQPCTTCGHAIKRIVQAGRSGFLCTACQR